VLDTKTHRKFYPSYLLKKEAMRKRMNQQQRDQTPDNFLRVRPLVIQPIIYPYCRLICHGNDDKRREMLIYDLLS
jgi:hypothetical protein